MKRTQPITSKQADAILTSDWHLREDTPPCRVDNFWNVQWGKVMFVKELQREHDCPVLHAGDLFHHWKPSPYLLSQAIIYLPDQFHTVYGQHDLPQHNLELAYKCGINTLYQADVLNILTQCHWQKKPTEYWKTDPGNIDEVLRIKDKTTLVWHVMNYIGRPPWPGCEAPRASRLLNKYPQFDLIVTGDNHKPFTERYEGRLLVNPGSLTRQSADETHRPRVHLWYADRNTLVSVYLPIDEDAVSRDHIQQQEQRDERIEAFVKRLNTEFRASVSFEENLEQFLQTNRVTENVKQVIYKAMEE